MNELVFTDKQKHMSQEKMNTGAAPSAPATTGTLGLMSQIEQASISIKESKLTTTTLEQLFKKNKVFDPSRHPSKEYEWPLKGVAFNDPTDTASYVGPKVWSAGLIWNGSVCMNIAHFAHLRNDINNGVTYDLVNLSNNTSQNFDFGYPTFVRLFGIYSKEGILGIQKELNTDGMWGVWNNITDENGNTINHYISNPEAMLVSDLFANLNEYDDLLMAKSIESIKDWENGRKDSRYDELRGTLINLIGNVDAS